MAFQPCTGFLGHPDIPRSPSRLSALIDPVDFPSSLRSVGSWSAMIEQAPGKWAGKVAREGRLMQAQQRRERVSHCLRLYKALFPHCCYFERKPWLRAAAAEV